MKIFEGIVKSITGTNTAIIEIERLVPHRIYKKLMKKTSTLKTDTTGSDLKIGDKIKIVEVRPISKNKNFKIYETSVKKEAPAKGEEKKK